MPLGGPRLRVRPQYARDGIPGAPETLFVRAGVRERLLQAARALPEDIALLVFDGYRPLSVQQYLFDQYWADIAASAPELTDDAVRQRVLRFVAAPSPDPACPPPHRTGGAVDVVLVEAATGAEIPMGTAADETAPASATRWFEERPEEPFTTNRRLLFHAMIGAGFTNYRAEWWHYDFGNQRWANCAGAASALYGIAREREE